MSPQSYSIPPKISSRSPLGFCAIAVLAFAVLDRGALRPGLVPWQLLILVTGLFLVVPTLSRFGLAEVMTALIGTDSGHRKTQELLCQEYVLQTEKTVYRIRPRDEKHPVLLPVGEQAQFRLEKDKMLLRLESADPKEHEYIVVSMQPRSESTADATPVKANHLQ